MEFQRNNIRKASFPLSKMHADRKCTHQLSKQRGKGNEKKIKRTKNMYNRTIKESFSPFRMATEREEKSSKNLRADDEEEKLGVAGEEYAEVNLAYFIAGVIYSNPISQLAKPWSPHNGNGWSLPGPACVSGDKSLAPWNPLTVRPGEMGDVF